MREKYESLAATVLKDLAKARGIKGASSMRKAELVEAMLAQDELEAKTSEPEVEEPANDEEPFEDTTEEKEALEEDTPAEQDNAEEIINAIKKFYPWQDVKDILIKMVWKLMGL